jgi:hypothetical protein
MTTLAGQLRDWVDVYAYSNVGTDGHVSSRYTKIGRHPMRMEQPSGREVTRAQAVGQRVDATFLCREIVTIPPTGLLVFGGQDYRVTAVLRDFDQKAFRILTVQSDQADYVKVDA